MSPTDGIDGWESFLNPEITRPRMIAAALYIAAFESLKESVIGRIKSFFTNGFDQDGPIVSNEYKNEVLSKARSPTEASVLWLQGIGAVDDADIRAFHEAKRLRNTLAHERLGVLVENGLPEGFDDTFDSLAALLRKVEVWWIVNVELQITTDFHPDEIDEERILPGPVLALQALRKIALGTEEESRSLYEDFRRYRKGV